ncbi:hypothetical protein ACFVZD_45320 [Streptomyces sp. NPDC058287]|uniref:hypothetical protein n=1 Tax=unclassified Streptomyces TaxID=2593676 RepID=UPI0036EDD625
MIETPAKTPRTPGQTRRRRALQNAAAGRPTVVLYTCIEDDRTTAAKAVETLRRFAIARDWEVSEIILDSSPLLTPLKDREQWTAALDAINERRAEGIVVVQGHICDTKTATRAALVKWLAEQGAFIAVALLAPSDKTDRTPA